MYTVTRQRQWPSGREIVEISEGGIDYTNPDALSAKYPGEFDEFTDPREAVKAAIQIADAWAKDTGRRFYPIAIGATMGWTMPFDPTTRRDAKRWARLAWTALPKCPGCGEPLPDDERKRWSANDWDGLEYCDERCATRAAEFNTQCEAELAEPE